MLLERLVEVAAEPRDPVALRLALGGEPVGVGDEARFRVAEEMPLPLGELGEPLLRRVGGAVEVALPVGEPLRDLRLRRR